MPASIDTIAAISSAARPAARIILRLSGPDSLTIIRSFTASLPDQAGAFPATLTFRNLRVPADLFVFIAPHSYTGQDLVEIHIPGSPLLAGMLLGELLRHGARAAEAGEFTARAFFNGRMDLAAAEGVAAAIAAQSDRELLAARQLLAGELARRLKPAMDLLADTLTLVEVGIDFSEEDVTFLAAEAIAARAAEVDSMLGRILADSARFETLTHEPVVVLVGRPNVGKSTLLNALARRPRAVVSPLPGTTRDALASEIALPRGLIRLLDIAGLSSGTAPTPIEAQMQAHALRAVESADFIIYVDDTANPSAPLPLPRSPDLTVRTKADLLTEASLVTDGLVVSALTGHNLDAILLRLDSIVFGQGSASPTLALNARHLTALDCARAALARITPTSPELIAFELREALDALGQILGFVSPDDLLTRVFSRFCIGK